jgi:hypothetical protein
MFERFTAYARRAVVTAQEEARELNHNYIGTEHILLALLRRPDGLPNQEDGIAAAILEEFGMTREGVREEVMDKVGVGKGKAKTGHIPFTPRAKKVLELALREALQLHHNYIGTEHMLLGLIREDEGVAVQIMRKHADLLALRAAVLDAVPAGESDEGGLAAATGTLLRRVRARHWGPRDDRRHPDRGRPAGRRRPDRVAPPAAGRAGRSQLDRRADAGGPRRRPRPGAGAAADGGRDRYQRRAAGGGRPAPDVHSGRGRDAHRRHRRPGPCGGGKGGAGGRERERQAG